MKQRLMTERISITKEKLTGKTVSPDIVVVLNRVPVSRTSVPRKPGIIDICLLYQEWKYFNASRFFVNRSKGVRIQKYLQKNDFNK